MPLKSKSRTVIGFFAIVLILIASQLIALAWRNEFGGVKMELKTSERRCEFQNREWDPVNNICKDEGR